MDILLDEQTHDIVFINGASPVTTSKQHAVQQRLKIMLQTFLGEWFLDLDIGIPYFESILTKVSSKSAVDLIFQRKILADPDVVEMVEFNSSLDASIRNYSMNFTVRTEDGSTVTLTISTGV